MKEAQAKSGRRGGDALIFCGIALLAFLVRWIYLHQARAVPMFDALIEDGESYGAWSDKLAAGDWVGDTVFYQAPLYPYFLGAVKVVFGRSLETIRLVQIALGALTCGVLFLAAKSCFSRAAGIASGLLLAFYPSAIFFDGCIQKANLGLLLMTLLILALVKLCGRASVLRWLALGVTLALLMLTREETRLLVPVLALWLLWHFREHALATRGKWLGAFALGLALPLVPVAWRNHAVGGGFVLTTSQAGTNFYIGNNARATGSYVPLRPGRSDVVYEAQDARDIAEYELHKKLTPAEVSDFWFDKAFAYMRSEPAGWIGLVLKKTALFVNAYEVPDAEDLYFYERYVPLLRVLDWILPWGVLAPLGLAGMWLVRSRRRELGVFYAVFVTLAASVIAVYVMARYRYSIVPLLALFAGALLIEAWQHRRALGELRGTWIALALAALCVNWPIHPRDFQVPQSYNNAAITREQKGDLEGAIALYREALAIQPQNPQILGNLGLALEHTGKIDGAIEAYRAALALRQSSVYDFLRLANVLARTNQRNEAVRLLGQAEPLALNDAVAWRDLGIVYTEARRYEQAIRCELKSNALNAKLVEPRLRLAWLLACAPDDKLRKGEEALRLVRGVLLEGTNSAFTQDVLGAACAENGMWKEAADAATRASTLAQAARSIELPAMQQRLQSYGKQQPWRLPAD